MMRFRALFLALLLSLSVAVAQASEGGPRFSVAGFYPLAQTGRTVHSMNPGWRFHKGACADAWARDFDDSSWAVVSLPHGLETLPVEASGCVNYQGEAWYRKHFKLPTALRGKKLFLHFEAIMGKCKVWVNGKLLREHFGGYLPVIVDVTEALEPEGENCIAVWADNSDDPSYPPGKQQDMLDFAYLGGIYRDCWLIAHNEVFITDPNYEGRTAGGGLFVSFGEVSEQRAELRLRTEIKNERKGTTAIRLRYILRDSSMQKVAEAEIPLSLDPNAYGVGEKIFQLQQPKLWSPEHPYLYRLEVLLTDTKGKTIDGYSRRVGIRSVEFKGKQGFWLNGKPYGRPIIGANRHQDHAVVGNALSNNLHWRDAVKLRRAGFKLIRNAHYPQDPAFMDACDELGLFVIVTTPGWQFWNKDGSFEQRVYSDIRNMVRRDRNHPCIFLWEPILNETWYPDHFAKRTKTIVEEEYPYPYVYTACDLQAKGHEHFPVLYMHPMLGKNPEKRPLEQYDPEKTYLTREWGDNVDNWNSHNSPSRVARNWGEYPMLVQAQHYANPPYTYTSYETLHQLSPQHIGGCLWHPFDHQRGYHPDPFYGGIMDAFRQPKLSYYMFMAQRDPREQSVAYGRAPMVYIANAMTPFSPQELIVYSNCDSVILEINAGGEQRVYRKEVGRIGMPSPVIRFPDAFDVMRDKALCREKRIQDSYLYARGYLGGKLVAEHKVFPARRPSKIKLELDNEKQPLRANGGELLTVIASVTDEQGNVKRLHNGYIRFELEGDAQLVGTAAEMLNPMPVQWGTAAVMLRLGLSKTPIKLRAHMLKEGVHTPISAELILQPVAAEYSLIYSPEEMRKAAEQQREGRLERGNARPKTLAEQERERKKQAQKLREVSKQQTEFGEILN